MKLTKGYKQIHLSNSTRYDELKGKVVDKVAFSDVGDCDENIFVIMFTDKTYIALGADYSFAIDECDEGEPQLVNHCYATDPETINGGDFSCHMWSDSKGVLRFDRWIQILKDLGIWTIDEQEVIDLANNKKALAEKREYEEYLRLKKKYEGE